MDSAIVQETWLPIVGWETVYQISNFGRVMRIKKGIRGGKIGFILKWTMPARGYPVVRLRDGERGVLSLVHRLVAAAFLGPCPEGKEVNHKDGNTANPFVENLEYLTHGENMAHSYRVLGRSPVYNRNGISYGESNGNSKLSNEQILEIRERYDRDRPKKLITQASLAIEYGVNPSLIGFIVRGDIWKHLLPPPPNPPPAKTPV